MSYAIHPFDSVKLDTNDITTTTIVSFREILKLAFEEYREYVHVRNWDTCNISDIFDRTFDALESVYPNIILEDDDTEVPDEDENQARIDRYHILLDEMDAALMGMHPLAAVPSTEEEVLLKLIDLYRAYHECYWNLL